MATIFIDDKPYDVTLGESLLKTCLGLGFDIPYFCWHPALHSVGACRQCAVKQFKDEKDTKGKIVMSCMTPVSEGMRISVDDPEVRRFRAAVIEWLMTNHPHDCPVCDEGGECHLQDMTVMTGHAYRRFRFRKRTHVNQNLGPFVNHEMNRCIACYRCTRFYNDYAGGTDFGVFASHHHVYFGRAESGVLESAFTGNLVEICPTGVFTDKPFGRHYARKWDLRTAPSVCIHCGVGCNTTVEERYGALRRVRNRYNGEVNGYFLCDRGRYGYEFVNSERRITEPRVRPLKGECQNTVSREEALDRAARVCGTSRRIIGIGSPRASLEANFALRSLVGEGRFYAGVAGVEGHLVALALDIMGESPDMVPSLRDVAACDAVFVLGEDVANTAPMLGLSVLQALRQKPLEKAGQLKIPYWDDRAVRASTAGMEGPLFIATTVATRLDSHASGTFRAGPADLGQVGNAVAREIDPGGLPGEGGTEAMMSFVASAAAALMDAKRPLIISGVTAVSAEILQGAADIARSLRRKGKAPRLCFVVPECNSAGLALMTPKGLAEAFVAAAQGEVETAIILENDLYRRAPEWEVAQFLKNVSHTIVVDHLFHRTSLSADALLPAATFAEGAGTFVNYEGRAQRYFPAMASRDGVLESWRWFKEIMTLTGRREAASWDDLDEVIASMARSFPVLERVNRAAPDASFRKAGMKVAREHPRSSGRTAMHAGRTVFEPRPRDDRDAPFSFSMEGYSGQPPSALIPRFWAPGWNSVQSVNKFQTEVGGELKGGDPGVRLTWGSVGPMPADFRAIPPSEKEGNLFLVVPFYHVFGSDELSLLSPGVRLRAPEPYVALSTHDAVRLNVMEGDHVAMGTEGQIVKLPVKVMSELPPRVAGLPHGVPGSPVLGLPSWVEIKRA